MDVYTTWSQTWHYIFLILKWGFNHAGLIIFLTLMVCAALEFSWETKYSIAVHQFFGAEHRWEAFSLICGLFSIFFFILLLIWRFRDVVYYIP